jgi:hypothetical protein
VTEFAFNIDVPVRSEWKNVNLLVTSVQNCFNAMFANIEGSHTIAMVTGELLENAIKYGNWDNSDHHLFRLSVAGRGGTAQIVVQNPSEEASAAVLKKTLAWIKSFESPEEAYRAKLVEIAQSPPSVDVSSLGLVRIAYEGACTIDSSYEAGVVRVTANVTL